MLNEVDALVTLNYELYDDDCVKEMTELRDKVEKPIFVIPGHAAERRTGMALLTKNGIPTFHIPERAMKTLAAMLRYVNYRRQNQRRK
jgi:acyl-CoA synthetase (NDP forming)